MTDLEITKLCAEAMGYAPYSDDRSFCGRGEPFLPLTDDAQAMALVKKLRLRVLPQANGYWCVDNGEPTPYARGAYWLASAETLNRAVCECASQMQKVK